MCVAQAVRKDLNLITPKVQLINGLSRLAKLCHQPAA